MLQPMRNTGKTAESAVLRDKVPSGILCDLHTHSTFSDGTLTPSEIIIKAKELHLGAVALCDHNTTLGLDEFIHAGKKYGVTAVTAVEFSTSWQNREIHLIGMFIDEQHFDAVSKQTEYYLNLKEKSNAETVARLCNAGYELNYDNLKKQFGKNINRAHIALALVQKGYLSSVADAFRTLLSPSQGFYTPGEKADFFETLKFISNINAVSVLAHPFLSLTIDELEKLLLCAKAAGLDAIETRYSLFNDKQQSAAQALAKTFSLAESGGSDFHGNSKPDISLGTGKGQLKVPFEFFERLKEIKQGKMLSDD